MKQFLILALLLLQHSFTSFAQDQYLNKGNQYLSEKNYSAAEKTFRAAIKSDGKNLIYQCQLALSLLSQGQHIEAQKIIDKVLAKDSTDAAAIWYGGINNFFDKNGDLRKSIGYFERIIPRLDETLGQYFSAHWFIGRAYRILLQSEGLTYREVSRMLDCYSTYLRLQPQAEDATEISTYVKKIKEIRPTDNVSKWINKPG